MTGALLAGGRSRRMGTDKAFIRIGEETIIERVLKVLKEVFDETVIVVADVLLYEALGERVARDLYMGAGSLGGIFTALMHASGDRVFVAACDMPAIRADAVRAVVDTPIGGFDAVVPFSGGKLHPLHAVYKKTCLVPMEEMIRAGELRVGSFLERIKVKRVTEPAEVIGKSVVNINTAEELERITSGEEQGN